MFIFTLNMESIWYQLLLGFSASIHIATIAGFITYKKLNKELRIIFYYAIISSIFGGIMTYMTLNSINNTLLYNIFTLIEFGLLSYAIWLNQKLNFFKWTAIIGTLILCTLFTSSFIDKALIYNNTLRLIEASLFILMSITYLIRIFGESFMKFAKDPFKYIIIGIFTYFSSSILILSAGNQVQLFTREQFVILFFINSVFYSIMVLLIIISFIKCYKK